jgi:D-serine deaminase-like pyridoxal phosphate-dependent protein
MKTPPRLPLESIPTPALVVDATVTRRNIDQLAGYGAQHGIAIRPHTKTHKSRMVGQLQLQAGAGGLTVAKVGEAGEMAPICYDLLMAYPAVDAGRCARLAEIGRGITMRIAVDSTAAVEALAAAARSAGSTLGLLVDLDVGNGRTGVASPADSLRLAQAIAGTAGVRLDGLMIYPGHIWARADQQGAPLAAVSAKVQEALALWSAEGLEAKIVSGGSTPTAYQSHLVQGITEIRPGTYVFNDMNTVVGGYCELEDCAARIVCTVVSDAVKDQVVIDAGTKALTSDLVVLAKESGHGHVVEYPRAKITRLSEEHGQVDVSLCDRRPKIGERVTVIPNHICPCVNLRDEFWWCEPGQDAVQVPVDSRGMLS